MSTIAPASNTTPKPAAVPSPSNTIISKKNLLQQLPAGSVLAFQTLAASFTNQGNCLPSNYWLTVGLVTFLSATCIFFSFTDSVRHPISRKVYKGVALPGGLHVLNLTKEERKDIAADLKKHRLKSVDWVHAFLSAVVFLTIAGSDVGLQNCFFPDASEDTRQLLRNLPLGMAVMTSFLFIIFPTTRNGITFDDGGDQSPSPGAEQNKDPEAPPPVAPKPGADNQKEPETPPPAAPKPGADNQKEPETPPPAAPKPGAEIQKEPEAPPTAASKPGADNQKEPETPPPAAPKPGADNQKEPETPPPAAPTLGGEIQKEPEAPPTATSKTDTDQEITPGISKTADKVLTTSANLLQLLPTGAVLAFQTLSASFTNQGKCHRPSNVVLTIGLVTFLGATCIFSAFTDSVRDANRKHRKGVALPERLHIFTMPMNEQKKDPLKKQLREKRLKTLDWVHAFFTLVVFLTVAGSDVGLQNCFFPTATEGTKQLLKNLPLGMAVMSSFVFMIFPTTRKGILFDDSEKSDTSNTP
ncbi:hypothetical protein EJB05_27384, partial [Eragrostis curvula]